MLPARPKIFILAPIMVVVWLVMSLVTYQAWVHGADHRDFYPRWAGARLALFRGQNLYSLETSRQIQVMLYGHALPPEVDQQGFAYPAQLLVVLYPFWFINNVEIATAAWEGLSIVLLLVTLLAVNNIRGRPLPAWTMAGLLLWQYPLLMVFQGQFTVLPLLGLVLGYRAFCRGQNVQAGAWLCLGVVKPEISLVPWLLILFLAIKDRRWKLVGTFFSLQAVIFLLSLVLVGWWLPDWLEALTAYVGYAKAVWAPLAAWQASPLLAVLLAALLLWSWRTLVHDRSAAFAASIPIGLLVLPQTLMWGLTMLLAPLALAWKGRTRWLVTGVWLTGWLFLLAPPAWWPIQSVLLPALALICIILANRPAQSAFAV